MSNDVHKRLRAEVERELRAHGCEVSERCVTAAVTAVSGFLMDAWFERDAAIAELRALQERVHAIAESLHAPPTSTRRDRA